MKPAFSPFPKATSDLGTSVNVCNVLLKKKFSRSIFFLNFESFLKLANHFNLPELWCPAQLARKTGLFHSGTPTQAWHQVGAGGPGSDGGHRGWGAALPTQPAHGPAQYLLEEEHFSRHGCCPKCRNPTATPQSWRGAGGWALHHTCSSHGHQEGFSLSGLGPSE